MLEDHPFSAVRGCLLNVFAATLHIGGHSSDHNLRMCHVVDGDPLIMDEWLCYLFFLIFV
jgi:hypothetical protein